MSTVPHVSLKHLSNLLQVPVVLVLMEATTSVHKELEECIANFVGKPPSIVFGMGYVINSVIILVLIGKGGLIISDSLNHSSIVNDEDQEPPSEYFNIIASHNDCSISLGEGVKRTNW